HISDALQTGCKKCTPNQREGARRVISHMIKEEPEYWTMLVEKYDPERMYSTKYEKEINKNINEALQNDCDRCTAKQRERARRIITHMIDEEPRYWTLVAKKYDPKGIYGAKYEKDRSDFS
ncbi:hypothetical protein JYU34_014213, partial [Plutella xylostella]